MVGGCTSYSFRGKKHNRWGKFTESFNMWSLKKFFANYCLKRHQIKNVMKVTKKTQKWF